MAPARPYRFIHFYRNPVSKLSSGYLYLKTGVERWTDSYTLSADAVCGLQTSEAVANKRNPAELCRALKLCKLCCAAVLETAGLDLASLSRRRRLELGLMGEAAEAEELMMMRGGAAAGNRSSGGGGGGGSAVSLLAARETERRALRMRRGAEEEAAEEDEEDGEEGGAGGGVASFDPAAVRADVDRAEAFLCKQVRSLGPNWKPPSGVSSSSGGSGLGRGKGGSGSGGGGGGGGGGIIGDGGEGEGGGGGGDPTFLDVLREQPDAGLLFEASVQFFENYRMAQIVQATAGTATRCTSSSMTSRPTSPPP